MEYTCVPDSLKDCDQAALQDYVTSSIIRFTSHPEFFSLLGHGQTPENIQKATLHLLLQQQQHSAPLLPLASLRTPQLSSPLPQAPTIPTNHEFTLSFNHDCQNLGCADLRCQLCTHAQARRCSKNFCSKYLVGDVLKAECGAPIRVEALDKFTGEPLLRTALHGVKLDAVLLNGKSVQVIKESTGGQITPRDLEQAAVPTYSGRFLLDNILFTQGQYAHTLEGQGQLHTPAAPAAATPLNEQQQQQHHHTPEGCAILAFHESTSEASISTLMVTGSSEGILSGQRPQFMLLVRAIDAVTNIPLPSVPSLLSDGFIVATSRVRNAIKKTIPHLNDDVSKLNAIGKAAVEKLKHLRQAAIDGGCPDLQFPLTQVSTVAEFRQLADWATQSKEITDKVKKIFKLSQGWNTAREHAAMAVEDDTCLRAWWVPTPQEQQQQQQQNSSCALVYAADKGVPLLSQGPIALLEMPSSSSNHQQPSYCEPATLKPLLNQYNIATVIASQAAWYQPYHPGWIRFPLPLTAEFFRNYISNRPQQPLVLSSQLMAMCCQYSGQLISLQTPVHTGIVLEQGPVAGQMQQQQLQQPPALAPPPVPPLPPLSIAPIFAAPPPISTEYMPGFSSMLQSFPSIPNPYTLSRLLSSLPSFDSEQAAAAAAAAADGVGPKVPFEDGKELQKPQSNTNNNNNNDTFLGRAISQNASDLLALLPAAGGSGNSGSLFRGLSPDWGELNSFSPHEWHQLLQLAEFPLNAGGIGDEDLPSHPPSNTAAAGATPLQPPVRTVSVGKSTFSGTIIEQNDDSPFVTRSPSQAPLPPLPPLPPLLKSSSLPQQEKTLFQEPVLNEEPSLREMLSLDEVCAGEPAKKRQSREDGEGGGQEEQHSSEQGKKRRISFT